MRYPMPSIEGTVQSGELLRFMDALRDDIFIPAWRLLPGRKLKDRLDQFFVNKGMIKREEGKIRFKPSIAKIYKAPYGFHIILSLFPGLSIEDLYKCISGLEYACGGEIRLYQDVSGWIHLKVYTKHLPKQFLFSQRLTERLRMYPLALPVGVSRQGLVSLKLYRDEEFGCLIAGMPGWGKSVLFRLMLLFAILNYTPQQVELYLTDLKDGIEFEPFQHVPHTRMWAGDVPGARKVVNKLLKEIERRSVLFKQARVTSLEDYNKVKASLPHIIYAVDEYADLEDSIKADITKVARKGRSYGVHPILCVQRPTTDSLPGATKGLLPVIISFKAQSRANSRYVLGEENSSAAYLKNKGRAIMLTDYPKEVQVMYISQAKARELIEQRYPVVPQAPLQLVQGVTP